MSFQFFTNRLDKINKNIDNTNSGTLKKHSKLTDVFHTKGVITLSTGHAVHDTYTAFLPPLLPAFIEKLSLSMTSAGLLSVFMQIPSLLQPAIGHLSDRHNLRYIVILAPASSAFFMSLLGIAPSYAVLALFLMIVGITSAGFHAVGPVMTGYMSGPSLGKGMSYWMVGGELGRTLGPIIIVSAVLHLTLNGMPWLMLAGLSASLLLYLQLKNVPIYSPKAGQGLPWRKALSGMRVVFLPLVCVIIVRSFMLSAITIYLPTFLTGEGAGLWTAGASLTILQAAGVVGAMISGSISDRLGRKIILFISLALTPLFMLLFLSVHGWVNILAIIMLGFFAISITPVMMALVQESFPKNRAFANGLYMSLSFVIRSGAVLVLGIIGDWMSLKFAFGACAVLMILGLPFVFLLPKRPIS